MSLYELINFLVVLSLDSMITFRIYLRPVCVGVASRCQSSRTTNNNFHPSSSITRYRLATSGNNSAPKSSSHVKEKEKEREKVRSVLFFSPSFDKKIEFREIECLQIQTLTNENCQQQSALKLFFLWLRDLFADGQMDRLSMDSLTLGLLYFPIVILLFLIQQDFSWWVLLIFLVVVYY